MLNILVLTFTRQDKRNNKNEGNHFVIAIYSILLFIGDFSLSFDLEYFLSRDFRLGSQIQFSFIICSKLIKNKI